MSPKMSPKPVDVTLKPVWSLSPYDPKPVLSP